MAVETTAKEKKAKKERVRMPEQAPKVRARNFIEVPTGFTREMAKSRGLAAACNARRLPVSPAARWRSISPRFIKIIEDGDIDRAAPQLKNRNSLPAPSAAGSAPRRTSAKAACILSDTKGGDPVAIGRLERFSADWQLLKTERRTDDVHKRRDRGTRECVVGSGRGGLSGRGRDLAKMGHKADLFEALHKPGGVLCTASRSSVCPRRSCPEGGRLRPIASG